MRALYDTTILASGIVARADPLARVLDAVISGQVELVTSEYIIEELHRTLETKPYFVERVSPSERETYLARIKAAAILVAPPGAVSGVVADPADDPFSPPPSAHRWTIWSLATGAS
jgi:predicted nucleic acid-binding protein